MNHHIRHKDFVQEILIDFIYAGCTALALALSFIYSGSWFFYLISLLPFLYRISKVDMAGSAMSGGFFAISLLFIIFPPDILTRPIIFYFIIISFSAAIVIFSMIINKYKKRFILGLILSAILCFPLGYLLKAGIESGPAISQQITGIGFNYRITALLCFLFISLLIVAINSLLLILINILCELPFAGRHYRLSNERFSCGGSTIIVLLKHWKCLPSFRAPPISA
jgi:uncharacterized membrane protein